MKRVTGIGGIFFKCRDPKKMTEWYRQHLGLNTNPYGATFEWFEGAPGSRALAARAPHEPNCVFVVIFDNFQYICLGKRLCHHLIRHLP